MALLFHQPSKIEGSAPGVDKNDALPDVQRTIEVRQLGQLLGIIAHVDERLGDCRECQVLFLDLDGGRLRDDGLCKPFDVIWPRSGEQKHLQILWQHVPDGQHLRTHHLFLVNHLVGLVYDEDAAPSGLYDPLLDQILKLPRRADHNVRLNLARRSLLLRHSQPKLYTCELAQSSHHIMILRGQLARRTNADCLRRFVGHVHRQQHGQREGGRLPRAVLRLPDDVPSLQSYRQCPLLNFRGLHETHLENPI
mmetsp:Transcript_1404/g.2184  ORF Transcript_1404/g.2184 Transcript_1404/m.2184 type:complete len:251 (+) Transcript_1404:398-1150(+)